MMWHVLFIGILRNIQFTLTTVKGKQCILYNVFDYRVTDEALLAETT